MTVATRQVDSRLPLVLLRAIKNQDTPPELLPEENPGAMFPHRLGLSGVIDYQIRQFRRLARRRRRVETSHLQDLLELIARRADAAEIFVAAGRELAGYHFSGPIGLLRRAARRLPKALRRRAAVRALRRANGNFIVASSIQVDASPLSVRAVDSLTASVGEDGAACQFYGALAAGLVELSGAGAVEAIHSECQSRGDDACVWELRFNGA